MKNKFLIICVLLISCFFLSGCTSSNSNYYSSNKIDYEIKAMEFEEKVDEYKSCIEDIRYTVDNALSDIKYPISNNDYNAAIDTIDGVYWCGL